MARPVLLLRLEGPMQSWGARSRWDVRDTQPEPTKSGIVGLLGCALGYRMYEPKLEELDAALRMGVRTERPGLVAEDYQTVTDYLPTANRKFRHSGVKTAASLATVTADIDAKPATIVSPRAYLQDAAFLVALESDDAILLDELAQALEEPHWPVFLGRKSCIPTRPVLARLATEYEGIEEALAKEPWQKRGTDLRERLECWLEAAPGDSGVTLRQDAMRVNSARQYGFRPVRRVDVAAPPVADEGGEA